MKEDMRIKNKYLKNISPKDTEVFKELGTIGKLLVGIKKDR